MQFKSNNRPEAACEIIESAIDSVELLTRAFELIRNLCEKGRGEQLSVETEEVVH